MSRLPLPNTESPETEDITYLNFMVNDIKCLTAPVIQKETRADPILSKVLLYLRIGWPNEVIKELKSYFLNKQELAIENDCVLRGYRIIIPEKLRNIVLESLHESHMGIVKTKALARGYVWWPKLDDDIENLVKSCKACIEFQDNPPKVAVSPWKWPQKPTQRLHADFAGPINNFYYLIILDAHSKWVDLAQMKSITSDKVITVFQSYISQWGIPITLVTDNGKSFDSELFQSFLSYYNIKHVPTSIYSPYSNGAAENAVRSFKKALKKLLFCGKDPQDIIPIFLFNYRSAPHCTTGLSPAELQIGRKLRTRFDLYFPKVNEKVKNAQEKQVFNKSGQTNVKQFEIGQMVYFKNYTTNKMKWEEGKILKKLGNVMYEIKDSLGKIIKRHVNQLVEKYKINDNKTINNNIENDQVEDDSWMYVNQKVSTPESNVPNVIQRSRFRTERIVRPKRTIKAPRRLDL